MSDSPATTAPLLEATLSDEERRALEEAGRSWAALPQTHRSRLPPIDPDLSPQQLKGSRPGDTYYRAGRSFREGLEKKAPGILEATRRASAPRTRLGRFTGSVRRTVLGPPLASRQIIHERLTKLKALAVLSSDALSSVAYATDQILLVLLAAGAAAYHWSLPIMVAIVLLLIAVVLSYRQTIKAYPKGGGSYIVAKDNLGQIPGLVAGSALMTDYVLTVAVSVASGVSAITSASPKLSQYTVPLCVGFIVMIVLGNLRGIRESATIFATPTYIFIGSIFVMLGVIFFKLATGDLHTASPHLGKATESISIFLVLRAFASGCTALTGVEAISDGVPAFKPPEWRNARTTLTVMGLILGLMFVGITVSAYALGLVPSDNNIILSQLAHLAFANGAGYYIVIAATTAILVLAANTSFSDFPRLFFFLSRDEYAPHMFKRLGDRLAYSNGIVTLGVLSTILVVAFKGSVDRLIPLYAIGVFLAFTLSQMGMVARHLRLREEGWRRGLVMNATGMTFTAIVLIITASVKFLEGAFVVVFIIPTLVFIFLTIHRHYAEVHQLLATEIPTSPDQVNPLCIVPVSDLNPLALQSLALARTISDEVIAVNVSDDPEEIARLKAKWQAWGNHVPLEIIESPYRSVVRPLLRYIDAIDRVRHGDTLVVVLPELVATRWWHQILHNQSALRLKAALLFRPGTVVVNVPYHLRRAPRVLRGRRRRRAEVDEL